MKYHLFLVLLFSTCTLKMIFAYEQHCIDPANCQFYPVHGCYATDLGLVCKNRSKLSNEKQKVKKRNMN